MGADQQRNVAWSGMGTGWSITSTLIAGMLTLGALGYLVDRLTGLHEVFLPIGIVLGGAAGIYAIFVRYGKGES